MDKSESITTSLTRYKLHNAQKGNNAPPGGGCTFGKKGKMMYKMCTNNIIFRGLFVML